MKTLRQYVETEILPRYDAFDPAHRRDHVLTVIRQSVDLAHALGLDEQMAYCIAAFHDVGLCAGRERHHLASAEILRADVQLRKWFDEAQISLMAEAVENHRASAERPPRSIYGKVVAEADRQIDADDVIRRTVAFGIANYPEKSREEHFQRMLQHLHEKYAAGGYLRLWLECSPNAARLERLRQIIRDEALLRKKFDAEFEKSLV